MPKTAGIYDAGDRSWMEQAKCVGMADEVFFPERGQSVNEAKAICASCPVREACLEYALVAVERFGIWGGASERERRRLRRRRQGGRAA